VGNAFLREEVFGKLEQQFAGAGIDLDVRHQVRIRPLGFQRAQHAVELIHLRPHLSLLFDGGLNRGGRSALLLRGRRLLRNQREARSGDGKRDDRQDLHAGNSN
jgi:hypothetical protein